MATDQVSGRGVPEAAGQPEGAMSRLQEQVQGPVQEKAKDMKAQASQKVREQLDTRTTDLGDQVGSVGQALRRSAEQLDQEGKSGPAGIARQLADRADRLGGYLSGSNSDRFLDDVESFARRRPWVAGGIGAIAGFAASRFLKASSGDRYAGSSRQTSHQQDFDAPLTRDGGQFAETSGYPPVEGRRP